MKEPAKWLSGYSDLIMETTELILIFLLLSDINIAIIGVEEDDCAVYYLFNAANKLIRFGIKIFDSRKQVC